MLIELVDLSDGALYRENSKPEVYVIYGQAKFWIPNPDVFNKLGFNWSKIQIIPDSDNTLSTDVSRIPIDGTLLREYSKPEVYVVCGSKKVLISDSNTLVAMGFNRSNVRVVPDGSLDILPASQEKIVVPTKDQLGEFYGKLRADLLSRHFALGRYFRSNWFSETNIIDMNQHSGSWLRNETENDQQKDRWRIREHTRMQTNPLLFSGLLMTCLAVEHLLGRSDSLKIIHLILDSMDSLFKFNGPVHGYYRQQNGPNGNWSNWDYLHFNRFDGYIIRYDAVSTDYWKTEKDDDTGKPLYNYRFPINQDGTYNYSVPLDDPRYARMLSIYTSLTHDEQDKYNDSRYDYVMLCRGFEASMDELTGLITGYDIVFRLVEDQTIRDKIWSQVSRLANYLAEHGYFLVRPGGGLNGHATLLEFSANRVFRRITGNDFSARVDFIGAMKQADVWNCLVGPINWATLEGIPIDVANDLLIGVLGQFGLLLEDFEHGFLPPGADIGIEAARAHQIYTHYDCLDTLKQAYSQENAAAYLFSRVLPPLRFQLFMKGQGTRLIFKGLDVSTSSGSATGFPPFIALTGLDDADTIIKDTYLYWIDIRRSHPEWDKMRTYSGSRAILGPQSTFANAVALLLGERQIDEQILVTKLKQRYCSGKASSGFPLKFNDNDNTPDPRYVDEDALTALDYMSSIALAWLYSKRKIDKGISIKTPDFPSLPNPASWPNAVIPANVLDDKNPNQDSNYIPISSYIPVDAIQQTSSPRREPDGSANLFLEDYPPKKAADPIAILPPPPTEIIFDKLITVHESDGDVDTGITIRFGDIYEVVAVTGEISSGDITIGNTGPKGLENRVEYDTTFPLHGVPRAHPYCLLGKLKNYFYIGDKLLPTRYLASPKYDPKMELPLYLRINDNVPGNGSGWFNCHVIVRRGTAPPPPPPNSKLLVKLQPYPIVFPARQTQVTLSITVNAQDSNTHAQISGRVIIDGKDVGSTNTPITYTFQQKRVRVFDPDLRKWTYEVTYPEGKVTASGYPDAQIDFGF